MPIYNGSKNARLTNMFINSDMGGGNMKTGIPSTIGNYMANPSSLNRNRASIAQSQIVPPAARTKPMGYLNYSYWPSAGTRRR